MVWLGCISNWSNKDKGVYDIAKNFAEKVGSGEIEAKPETQEEPKKTINL